MLESSNKQNVDLEAEISKQEMTFNNNISVIESLEVHH